MHAPDRPTAAATLAPELAGRTFGRAAPSQLAALDGLAAMQALIDGKLPAPTISRALNFWLAEVAPGRAVFEGVPTDEVLNPLGAVHGGWALTLLDSATGCAAHTTLPAGVGYTTVETKGNLCRAITPATGRVRCVGNVVAGGRQIITAEARLTDADGRLLAHGTSTLIVLGARG